jgi:chromate reductase, NAD(P)H dehydrogenase (quinone)
MKVLAFAASSSRKSINKLLATYAVGLLNDTEAEILDLNDYELPLYSEDKEIEIGQPQLAKDFLSKIANSDALIISFAEHNGSYTVAYKNLFDWCSRVNREIFQNKPLVFLATSPGKGGAKNVLAMAENSAKYFAGNVKASLSIPDFHENFDMDSGTIKNDDINRKLLNTVQKLDELKISI